MPLNLKSVANGSVILNPASTVTDKTITIPATDGTMVVQDGTNTTTITNLAYTGTLTGGTGVINIGSGQVYKDASGNVGIGTSSPGQKLSINSASTSVNSLVEFRQGDVIQGYAGFGSDNALRIQSVGTQPVGMSTVGAGYLFFTTQNTERMRLDSSGNLGIGVTPTSGWDGFRAAQIGAVGAVASADFGTGNVQTFLSNNAYYGTGSFRYIKTAAAMMYRMQADGHQWNIATSGTAGNAISFTQAMTLSATGNLGVGTTTTTNGRVNIQAGTAATGSSLFLINLDGTINPYLEVQHSSSGVKFFVGNSFSGGNNNLIFGSTSTAEAMRIDGNGNLLVACTALPSSTVKGNAFLNTATQGRVYVSSSLTGAQDLAYWINPNGIVGTITTSGSGTTYNTSSDYRLKDITGDLTNSGSFIDALKPKVGTWKADGAPFVGFLAHEFQEVSPSSVSGEKDAVDKDGNPKYQSMQASSAEVMANIIAELQSLRKRVAELEAA